MHELDRIVREIADEIRQRPDRGEVATYIPELARVDPAGFGIAVIDADGHVETSTCCQNLATEHRMAEKLMVDGCRLWVRHYRVDGFRFDLMGHHSRANLEAVRAALDELPPSCRDALLLSRVAELTHAEVAERLGVSCSMVSKNIMRALRHCERRVPRQ